MEVKHIHSRVISKNKNRFDDLLISDGLIDYYIMTKNKSVTFTITRYWDEFKDDCTEKRNETLPPNVISALDSFIATL